MTPSDHPHHHHPSDAHNPPHHHPENHPHQPSPSERSPGVYVRSNQYQPQEIDMLWSGSKHFQKEDRSPLVFTVAGLLLGIIITSALFFLFTRKPDIQTGQEGLNVPVISDTELLDDPVDTPMTDDTFSETIDASTDTALDAASAKKKESFFSRLLPSGKKKTDTSSKTIEKAAGIEQETTPTADASGPIIHVVRSGDSLGTIAGRYYNDSSEAKINQIVRANNLTNPDNLLIDQRLVIPQ